VPQVGYLRRLYRDARSTKHKILHISLSMRGKIQFVAVVGKY